MFSDMRSQDVQELHFFNQGEFRAVVALHNLHLGPALGGCRFIEYPSESHAITDAIRLAKGMSYKAALAKVPQGGGKSVIMKPSGPFDREKLFKWFGQCIESLGGRYITAMDSGTTVEDMDNIRSQTLYVSSTSAMGDPSPSTAQGMLLGIETALQFKMNAHLQDKVVAIQGLGHVGWALAKMVHEQGARLIVADIDANKTQQAKQQFNATVVASDEIYSQACDVFSPCGLGAILNPHTVAQLQCAIVAGCANNQLADESVGDLLHSKDILYAPDYVINSGGLIYASSQYRGLNDQQISHEIHKLKDTLLKIFVLSHSKNQACHLITNQMAEQILYGSPEQLMEAV